MVHRHLIAGYNQEIIFAERHGNIEKVIKVHIDYKTGNAKKQHIFEHQRHLIALHVSSKDKLGVENKTYPQFYMIDADLFVYSVFINPEGEQVKEQLYNY